MGNKQYKQFTINKLEDGCLALKSLIVPVIFNLEKFNEYSEEAQALLVDSKSDDVIPAKAYYSIHDKVLFRQRELLKFIADHQSSSFSYISLRQLLVKSGYLKRSLDENSEKILKELLEIRNWSFHNPQSLLIADLEIAKRSIPPELEGIAGIKPMLNPVVIQKVNSYSKDMLADFILHNAERVVQFDTILTEMKNDYQEMYESIPDAQSMIVGLSLPGKVQYIERMIENQNSTKAGSSIAALSMGIQKGKYNGTDESFEKLT